MQQKIFLPILIFTFLTATNLSAQFSGGNGTQTYPYLISNKNDMEALADSVANTALWSQGKYFELTQDIPDSVRKSVGELPNASSRNYSFAGHFDGNGYKITVSIVRGNTGVDIGCFGTARGATIQNLVVDGRVSGGTWVIGGVVGCAENGTTIFRCVNFSDVAGTYPGGIAGRLSSSSTLKHSINLGTTRSDSQMGGLICDGLGGMQMQNNLNMGKALSSHSAGSKCGGFNGDYTSNDNISNCIQAGFIPNGNSMYGDNATAGLATSINVGITARNNMSSTCFFDKQMFSGSNATTAQGRLTVNMVGNALQNILGNAYIYEDSLYPRLKNMPIEEPGYVAASPVFLRVNSDSDFDTYDKVRYCFKVSTKYGVQWRSKNNRVEINNSTGWVRLLSTGKDTLTAYLMTQYGHEATKIIPINITNIIPCYLLVLKVNPEKSGTATIIGTTGSQVVISAVPDTCYRFVNWTDTFGNIISVKGKDTITLIRDSVLIANFELIDPELTLQAYPANVATVKGSGIYNCFDKAKIEAIITDSCYKFLYWKDKNGFTISENQIDTITLISDSLLFAHFQQDTFYLELLVTPIFTPMSSFTVIGSGRYACKKPAEIKAHTESPCYKFLHWLDTLTKEIISTKRVDTILMTKDIVLLAVFYSDTTFNVDLYANPEEAGTVAGSGVYECEDEVTISAIPKKCYRFVNWTDAEGKVYSEFSESLLFAIADVELTANFVKIDFYEVRLSANPVAGGTVSGAGKYPCLNGTANITAIANEEFRFLYWRDKSNGNIFSTIANIHFEVNRDFDLEAVFAAIADTTFYLVDLRSEPQSAGTVAGMGIYNLDDKVAIKAVANAGYYFEHWRNSQGNIISTTANFELTVKSDTTLFAVFQPIPIAYAVTITANPSYMGTLDGSTTGLYPYDFAGTVKAIPKGEDYYEFIRWASSDGTTLTTDLTLNFVIKSDTHFVAHFGTVSIEENIKTTTISIIPNPTKDDFEISFEVQKPSNIELKLLDLSGAEVFEIFSDWTNEGIFSKTVNTKNLARGVYILHILIDGNIIVEKVVLE